MPPTPTLRREEIKLQVALITPLIHVNGYAAPETKAACGAGTYSNRKAEALGERPDDPLLLFSVLYGFWVANYVAFDGHAMRELAAQFLELAEKQGGDCSTDDRASSHGHVVAAYRGHRTSPSALDQVSRALRSRRTSSRWQPDLARTSGWQPCRYRSLDPVDTWLSRSGLADVDRALKDAREIGQAATLMYALNVTSLFHIIRRNFVPASAQTDEAYPTGRREGSITVESLAGLNQGCVLTLTGKASDAVRSSPSGISCVARNRKHHLGAVVSIIFGRGLC